MASRLIRQICQCFPLAKFSTIRYIRTYRPTDMHGDTYIVHYRLKGITIVYTKYLISTVFHSCTWAVDPTHMGQYGMHNLLTL